jgi:hypothetical protein
MEWLTFICFGPMSPNPYFSCTLQTLAKHQKCNDSAFLSSLNSSSYNLLSSSNNTNNANKQRGNIMNYSRHNFNNPPPNTASMTAGRPLDNRAFPYSYGYPNQNAQSFAASSYPANQTSSSTSATNLPFTTTTLKYPLLEQALNSRRSYSGSADDHDKPGQAMTNYRNDHDMDGDDNDYEDRDEEDERSDEEDDDSLQSVPSPDNPLNNVNNNYSNHEDSITKQLSFQNQDFNYSTQFGQSGNGKNGFSPTQSNSSNNIINNKLSLDIGKVTFVNPVASSSSAGPMGMEVEDDESDDLFPRSKKARRTSSSDSDNLLDAEAIAELQR